MTKGYKRIILLSLVAMFVLALCTAASAAVGDMAFKGTGGIKEAGIGTLGDTTVTPPFTKVLDLPALRFDRDANGRIVGHLPGLTLVSGRGAPAKLPKTGANVGDIFAAGMAALSGGGLLVRRLKLSLAS